MAQIGPFGPAESFSALEQLFVVLCRIFDRSLTTIRLTPSSIRPITPSLLLEGKPLNHRNQSSFCHFLPSARSSNSVFA